MKKLLFCITAVVMIAVAGCTSSPRVTPEQQAAQTAWEAENPQYTSARYFNWNIRDGGVRITGYTGTDSDLRIPPQINGMPVVVIGTLAFNNDRLTSVTIPDSVTSIDNYAFRRNRLTSVVIPNSVTHIGRAAFEENQLTSIDIPSGVTIIGARAFGDNRIVGPVNVPASASIGEGAFFRQRTSHGGLTFANVIRIQPAQLQQIPAEQQLSDDFLVTIVSADSEQIQITISGISGFNGWTGELFLMTRSSDWYNENFVTVSGAYIIRSGTVTMSLIDVNTNRPFTQAGHYYLYLVIGNDWTERGFISRNPHNITGGYQHIVSFREVGY